MARLKQAYYGSCFVASCMHLQLKKVDPFITKRAYQISVTWAHTLLFLGNTLPYCRVIVSVSVAVRVKDTVSVTSQ